MHTFSLALKKVIQLSVTLDIEANGRSFIVFYPALIKPSVGFEGNKISGFQVLDFDEVLSHWITM